MMRKTEHMLQGRLERAASAVVAKRRWHGDFTSK